MVLGRLPCIGQGWLESVGVGSWAKQAHWAFLTSVVGCLAGGAHESAALEAARAEARQYRPQ